MKKLIALLLLSTVSQVSIAAVISYGGYSHDDSTNIVVGNQLEWLQWDLTLGQSVQWALDGNANSIEGGGWRLANNSEMSQLFNAFDFSQGSQVFDDDRRTDQKIYTGISSDEDLNETDKIFISMFGDTFQAAYGPDYGLGVDNLNMSAAMFADPDRQTANWGKVQDDFYGYWDRGLGTYAGFVELNRDKYQLNLNYEWSGLALVREAKVPEPSILSLMGAGLAGLGFARRNRKIKA